MLITFLLFNKVAKWRLQAKRQLSTAKLAHSQKKNAQFSQNLMAMPEVVGETVSYMERFISF